MPFDSLTDDPVLQRFIAAGVFGGFLLAAVVLRLVETFVGRRLDRSRTHAVAGLVLLAVRNTGPFLLVIVGLFLAIAALPDVVAWRDEIGVAFRIVAALVITQSTATIVRVVFAWYSVNVAPRTATQIDDKMFPMLRRVLVVMIYGIGFMVALDALSVSISPILGGLGISGLAVALALQPTLSNFFAGTYVLSDGAINVGDYIELQGGPSGYVVEVGWRSTKIRTWLNNRVVIPNSIIADSIVINYSAPEPAMNILIVSGVSYDADLDLVEEVTMEVARQAIADLPDAVKTMDAYFGFDSFGDSNIQFWLFLQAKDRFGSFVVTNAVIKRLQARFRAEGIEINYPVRKLIYDPQGPPVPIATTAGP
jgi:small-conductance mechanosensitive channel